MNIEKFHICEIVSDLIIFDCQLNVTDMILVFVDELTLSNLRKFYNLQSSTEYTKFEKP